MSHGGERTGERLGPYQLDRRYEDLEESGGELYVAHHVETGRPALVLVPAPGERWAPRSDWSARVTAQSDPPFVATHLERPPPPGAHALTDVELAFIRMAGGMAGVEDREAANVAFTRLSAPGRSHAQASPRWRSVKTGALMAAGLMLGALLLLWPRPPDPAREETDLAPRAGPTAWIDQREDASVIGYPMPLTAYPEQARPPCPKGYEEIRGGCWLQAKQQAPCPQDTAEYEGRCYMPLREKKPAPRSLEP